MLSGLIAKKQGMTQIFTSNGERIAVTTLTVPTLTVTQLKTIDKDGYSAVQLAYGSKKTLPKATKEKLKKLNLDISPVAFKEFKPTSETLPTVGDTIEISSILAVGDTVDITGTSKGRGFAGVIKRYGFRRQPVSGGQSDRVRAPGSIGAQTPGKVLKGKKMPGHYGNKIKTISGIKIISIDSDNKQILVSGSVPGHINSWVTIYKA